MAAFAINPPWEVPLPDLVRMRNSIALVPVAVAPGFEGDAGLAEKIRRRADR